MNGKSMFWGKQFLLLVGIACGLAANVSIGATHQYDVLFDVDNNVTTGCKVSTVKGISGGIEQILRATVDTTTTTATVSALQQFICISDSTFSAPTALAGAPYTLTLGAGSGNTSAIELTLPLSAIALNPDPTQPSIIRIGALSLAADGSADALLPLTPFQIVDSVPIVVVPPAVIVNPPPQIPPSVAIPALSLEALLGLAISLAILGGLMIRRFNKKALNNPIYTFIALGIGIALFGLGSDITHALR